MVESADKQTYHYQYLGHHNDSSNFRLEKYRSTNHVAEKFLIKSDAFRADVVTLSEDKQFFFDGDIKKHLNYKFNKSKNPKNPQAAALSPKKAGSSPKNKQKQPLQKEQEARKSGLSSIKESKQEESFHDA